MIPHAMAPSGDLLLTALIPGKAGNIIWWVNQWLDFGWLVVKSILQNSRKNEWVAQKRQALPTQLIIDWLGGITTTTANKSIQKVKTPSFPPKCDWIFSRKHPTHPFVFGCCDLAIANNFMALQDHETPSRVNVLHPFYFNTTGFTPLSWRNTWRGCVLKTCLDLNSQTKILKLRFREDHTDQRLQSVPNFEADDFFFQQSVAGTSEWLLVFPGESEGLNLGGNIRMTANLWPP